MDWKEIAAVSGKSGLYSVVKPTRAGFILESIEKEKKRFMAGPSTRVSVLHEISIYTEEDAVPLSQVMIKIKKEQGEIKVDPKSDGAELMDFLKSIVPDYDEERVYASDVKKVINWYGIINEFFPELLEEEEVKEEKETSEEKPKKAPAKKKTPAAKKEEVASSETK